MRQLSWKNFPAKIEKSLCKLFGQKYATNPVHNSVTIYSAKVLSVFLCVKGASPPLRRVTFFCCQKKVTKENHLDLRSKNPLAWGETFLAGNFPTRPRRFFRFFPRSEGLCQHSFPRGAVARRCPVATVWFCALPVLAIIKSRPSRPEGGFGRCAPGRGGTSANVSLRYR